MSFLLGLYCGIAACFFVLLTVAEAQMEGELSPRAALACLFHAATWPVTVIRLL